jgi:hypothetical protein
VRSRWRKCIRAVRNRISLSLKLTRQLLLSNSRVSSKGHNLVNRLYWCLLAGYIYPPIISEINSSSLNTFTLNTLSALCLYRESIRPRKEQKSSTARRAGSRISGAMRGLPAPDGGPQPRRGHGLFGVAPPCSAKNGLHGAPRHAQ